VLEVSFRHPIRLIANALGVPPKAMIDMGKKHGVPVAALVGAKEHALRQVAAGVDILVVQGTEAGGHCGEVSTLVLVPEVIKAIKADPGRAGLAAGGIMTGVRWRRAWRWAPPAPGPARCGLRPSNPRPPKSSAKK